ncbi:homocysteine S-methyltransferase 1 [Denticeps clupeoides]|uniref:Hcy-binding domain-containing protein n=1 Tax=Denticeps clupeoides TaxID=299321 RepID=A0AAY4CWV1_9TELE|nr:homocysteine S-methyltransferase 1-like [Denticeps clupeoides]
MHTIDDFFILDGGLATELESNGVKIQGDPLWSARALHTNPKAVKDAHYRYLASGADVITTATYQATVEGFVRHLGVPVEQAHELLMSGVQLAKEAVEEYKCDNLPEERRQPLVAGSVGPYGAYLHDGSEYTGAYEETMTVEELKAWHRPQVQCLAAAGADLIAMETVPSLKEAEALVELLREFPESKAWLSFSCKDSQNISNGKSFSEAAAMACRSKQLVAVGVNCCPPGLVSSLLESAKLHRHPDIAWIVYPNSGEDWAPDVGWKPSENRAVFAEHMLSHEWRNQGATWIGGCCRVGPADITELRRQLYEKQ